MSRETLTVAGPAEAVTASDGGITLTVPIAIRRRWGRRLVTPPAGSPSDRVLPATPLQRALARGYRWLRMLETSEAASMSDIARQEGATSAWSPAMST